MECEPVSSPHGALWTSVAPRGSAGFPSTRDTCCGSVESVYSPLAFCGSRDTSARMFRLRIKRWR